MNCVVYVLTILESTFFYYKNVIVSLMHYDWLIQNKEAVILDLYWSTGRHRTSF